MSAVVVIGSALLLTGLAIWFFFGPRETGRASVVGGVQVVEITVQGGYSPDVVQVTRGVPVRMEFHRQEAGDCSSRVVIPAFKINAALSVFQTTAVEFTPQDAGSFSFACGMNMLRGRLVVAEADRRPRPDTPPSAGLAVDEAPDLATLPAPPALRRTRAAGDHHSLGHRPGGRGRKRSSTGGHHEHHSHCDRPGVRHDG